MSDLAVLTAGIRATWFGSDLPESAIERLPAPLLIIHGEDDFQSVRASYLKGSDGFVLVADGTRG